MPDEGSLQFPSDEDGAMTRVILGADCGNSPKNTLLQQLTLALAKGDLPFLTNKTTEDICWDLVGDRLIKGIDEICTVVESRVRQNQMEEIIVERVISHGKAGAVNGKWVENGKTFAFCHVFEFGTAKGNDVKKITSYVIEIE